jgi:hypothetical protein
MNKYIFVANVGDFMIKNVRASYEAAANRWDVQFVEYVGDRENAMDDKFAGIDEFDDEDMLMIADADILYRIDSPSPFQYGTDFGISVCTDVQRERGNWHDDFGSVSERLIGYWANQRGIPVSNCLPMNTGVLIAKVKNFKSVRDLYREISSSFEWDWGMMPQSVFSVVCEELQMPVIKMPDWVNKVNVVRGKSWPDFELGTAMEHYSFHPAGVPGDFKKYCLSHIDITKIPE